MSNENEAGVLRDEAENPEEQEIDARGGYTGWGLLAVAVGILGDHELRIARLRKFDERRLPHNEFRLERFLDTEALHDRLEEDAAHVAGTGIRIGDGLRGEQGALEFVHRADRRLGLALEHA